MKALKVSLPPIEYTSWIRRPLSFYEGCSKEDIINDLKEKFFEEQFTQPFWDEVEIEVIEIEDIDDSVESETHIDLIGDFEI